MFLKKLMQTVIDIWRDGKRHDALIRPAHCRSPMTIARVDRSSENPTVTFTCGHCAAHKQAFFSDVVRGM